jgi:hypothetical protein
MIKVLNYLGVRRLVASLEKRGNHAYVFKITPG